MNNQSVRIVSGSFRGRRLKFRGGDCLRPTSDRVRETLFNWLMHDIHGAHCLDAFSGSGALGLEALSRGAKFVDFFENDPKVSRNFENVLIEFGVEEQSKVSNTNTLKNLDRPADRQFDIVFVDPPFGRGWVLKTLELLVQNGWLHCESLVYVEVEKETELSQLADLGFEVLKQKATDKVCYTLLRVG